MIQPCDLTAVKAADLIRCKELSPLELLESCIARIEELNPILNAIVTTCFERAIQEARAAETALLKAQDIGPLHGLPVAIKDLNDTAGVRTTYGSLLFKDHIPQQDERVVAAVRHAGAIVIGKTNTPEFGAGATTNNLVFGATGNPFDPTLTCGGSTGGGAVAVASGMVPLATGSDSGGSLRTPAAFCGVVGVRSSPGLVPSDRRAVGLSPFHVQGPLGRTVGDAALLLSAMAGIDHVDPLSVPIDCGKLANPEAVDLSRLRVALSEDLGTAPLDDEIRFVFRERCRRFSSAFGSSVTRNPDFTNADRAFWIIRGVHHIAAFKPHYDAGRDKLGQNVRGNVEAALRMTAEEIGWAYAEQTRIYRSFQAFFRDYDLLITPAAAVSPFSIEKPHCTHINGREMEHYIRWTEIAYAVSLIGHPVVVLPCGRDHKGMPFALQIVGPRWSDRFTLSVANFLEALFRADRELERPSPDRDRLKSLQGREQ
jgi:amidase